MIFRVLPAALGDALAAASWYDDQQDGLGDEFLDEVQDAWETIRLAPESVARHEQYSGKHEVRRCILKRFPFSVVFLCRPSEIYVVAVAHTRRRPLYWLNRLA